MFDDKDVKVRLVYVDYCTLAKYKIREGQEVVTLKLTAFYVQDFDLLTIISEVSGFYGLPSNILKKRFIEVGDFTEAVRTSVTVADEIKKLVLEQIAKDPKYTI